MISTFKIFRQTFIEPFFRENAGAFIFFYTVAILAVGHLDGQGVLFYHHSLITGMLGNAETFILVCALWLLYLMKCLSFVTRSLRKPDSQFLYVINRIPFLRRFGWCALLMIILFFPIGWYGMLIIGVALYHGYFISAVVLSAYLTLLCLIPASWIVLRMRFPGMPMYKGPKLSGLSIGYPGILIQYIAEEQKMLFITIKFFTCALLYGFTRINIAEAYDVQFPFLFFSLGILANGILVHRVRSFEESSMLAYRSAPVSLSKRLLQYLLFYFILILPELTTIVTLTPVHLHYMDAAYFAVCAFGLVLLINSISFLEDFTMNQYLRVMLLVLCIQYFFVIADLLPLLCIIYIVPAMLMFYKSYYLFERRPKPRNGL